MSTFVKRFFVFLLAGNLIFMTAYNGGAPVSEELEKELGFPIMSSDPVIPQEDIQKLATDLNKAIFGSSFNEVKNILEKNPELINVKVGDYQETPLIRLTSKSRQDDDREIFDYLMTIKGIDINAVDKQDYNAIRYVFGQLMGNKNEVDEYMFKVLLEKNADVSKICEEIELDYIKKFAEYKLADKNLANAFLQACEKILNPVAAESITPPIIATSPELIHPTKDRPMGQKGRRLPSKWAAPTAQATPVIEDDKENLVQIAKANADDIAKLQQELEQSNDPNEQEQIKQEIIEAKEHRDTVEVKLEDLEKIPAQAVSLMPATPSEVAVAVENVEKAQKHLKKLRNRRRRRLARLKKKLAAKPASTEEKEIKKEIKETENSDNVCKREIYLLEKEKERIERQKTVRKPTQKAQTIAQFYGIKRRISKPARGSRRIARGKGATKKAQGKARRLGKKKQPARRKKTARRGQGRKKSSAKKHRAKRANRKKAPTRRED